MTLDLKETFMSDIRLVLADDHPIYRDGVALPLADAGGIEVVGQAQDGAEAARLCAALQPDLVLLDARCRRAAVWVRWRRLCRWKSRRWWRC